MSTVRRSGRFFRARIIAAAVVSLSATACDTRLDPPVGFFEIDQSSNANTGTFFVSPGAAVLLVGETVQLNVTADPALLPVSWRSSDTRIAVVSATGVVTALRPGAARITAQSINNPNRSGSAVVQVIGQSPNP